MTTLPESRESAARRAVLIDFDWQDADLMPALLRQPDVSVRLVAGEHLDDAGIRVAELCGVRHTIDLADLTREIFDLALVSERSSRRDQMEHLFRALGTPVVSPQDYLSRPGLPNTGTKSEVASNGLEARSARDSVPLDPMAELLAQELPDMSEDPAGERAVSGSGEPGAAVAADRLDTVSRREAEAAKPRKSSPASPPTPADRSVDLGPVPNPEDRMEIERALGRWAEKTAARSAELHTGVPGQVHHVSRVGAEDPFLEALIKLALQLERPHVVTPLEGQDRGKAWGAWPFRTVQRQVVVAAAAVDSAEGHAIWERVVDELREAWDRRDRECSVPVPGARARQGWLGAHAFRQRLELATERNRRDGLRFSVHRLMFENALGPVEILCQLLPERLRATDCICRPAPEQILLLCAGPAGSFVHIRRRLMTLWEQAWLEGGQPPPAPPVRDEWIELLGVEDAAAFLETAGQWLRQ